MQRATWRHRKWPCADFTGPKQPNLRHGQPCTILAVGKNGNTLVEFSDGYRLVGVRHCVTAEAEKSDFINFQIDTGFACALVVTDQAGYIIDSAPIFASWRNKHLNDLIRYYRKKGICTWHRL